MHLLGKQLDFGIFEGDGRYRIEPVDEIATSHPTSVTRAVGRRIISNFISRGVSQHSRNCGTLWIILYFCDLNALSYIVTIDRAYGCVVTLLNGGGDFHLLRCSSCMAPIRGYYIIDSHRENVLRPGILCGDCYEQS